VAGTRTASRPTPLELHARELDVVARDYVELLLLLLLTVRPLDAVSAP